MTKSKTETWKEFRRRRRRLRRIKRRLVEEDNHCAFCGRALWPEITTLDHLTPRSAGGQDDDENLILACWYCNKTKSDYAMQFVVCRLERGGGICNVLQTFGDAAKRTRGRASQEG